MSPSSSPRDMRAGSFSGTSTTPSIRRSTESQSYTLMGSPDSLDAFASVAIANQDGSVYSRDVSCSDRFLASSLRGDPMGGAAHGRMPSFDTSDSTTTSPTMAYEQG